MAETLTRMRLSLVVPNHHHPPDINDIIDITYAAVGGAR
jgi:hypothetical protein